MNYKAVAEAMIFAAGDPVPLVDIAKILKISEMETSTLLDEIMAEFISRDGGIILRKIENCYQFCSRPELHDFIAEYFIRPEKQSLSRAALETLTIIAYKQPVTKPEIDLIRGVNSEKVIGRLLEKGLIDENGRADTPGKPTVYVTTLEFLQSVGLESIKDLPILNGMILEEM
jgi:segregation and condensation protein B